MNRNDLNFAINRLKISTGDKLLLKIMGDYSDGRTTHSLTDGVLCYFTGWSERTVRRRRKSLVDQNIISKEVCKEVSKTPKYKYTFHLTTQET